MDVDYGNEGASNTKVQYKYPELHEFKQNEFDLYNTTKSKYTSESEKHITSKNKQSLTSPKDCCNLNEMIPEHESEQDCTADVINIISQELDVDLSNKYSDVSKDKCLLWDGCPSASAAAAQNPRSINQEIIFENDIHKEATNPEVLDTHNSFMKRLLRGENPKFSNPNSETDYLLEYCQGDRNTAAQMYLANALNEAKTKSQKAALKNLTNFISKHYFGPEPDCSDTDDIMPIITMVGSPGTGKSWIVNTLKDWVDIRIEKDEYLFESNERVTSFHSGNDVIAELVVSALECMQDGKFGKTVTVAQSGSAAGIVGGFTIHSAFSFSIDIHKKVRNGEEPLPPLSSNSKASLFACWRTAKVLIIDEVYTLSVEWLSLIDERLRQIFNNDYQFGGLVVILVGVPRQIIPVSGKPFYDLSKYFSPTGQTVKINDLGSKILTLRELRGYNLYASCIHYILLTHSIRRTNREFAEVNKKIAKYEVLEEDVHFLNKLVKPVNELLSSPWIEAPWLLPTWQDVNAHLRIVTEHMSKQKAFLEHGLKFMLNPVPPEKLLKKPWKASIKVV